MPLFLVGLGGLGVPPLVVADDVAGVPHLGDAPPPAEHRPAPLVQRPAHLLGRHLRVFPPAAAPCGWPRTPGRPGPGSGAAPARCSPAPRSASARPPACRGGRRAPPSTGGRPRPAPELSGAAVALVRKYFTSPVASLTAATRVCSRSATHTVAVAARQNDGPHGPVGDPVPRPAPGVRRGQPGVRPPGRTARRVPDGEVHRHLGHEPLAHQVQEPQERDGRPVPLVERQPVERHPVARSAGATGPPPAATSVRCRTSSGMPAARHRGRSAAHDFGRYRSASSRAWKVPLATPTWTVTMPLSTLPTHPRYCRCTPGVWSPHFRQLVSSITPTVPERVGREVREYRTEVRRIAPADHVIDV